MRLALLSAAWIGGVLLGLDSGIGTGPLLLVAAAGGAAAAGLWLARIPALPALLAVVLLLGMARAESAQLGRSSLEYVYGEEVSVLGRIADDPEIAGRQVRFEVDVSSVLSGGEWEPLEERWLVYARPTDELVSKREHPYFRYGDEVFIEGTPQTPQPFEGFDYASYLAARGITATMFARDADVTAAGGTSWRSAIYYIRGKLTKSIERSMPYPESALASAMLLGKRENLPPDLVEKFRGTGASHLLAISGLHVGILLAVALGSAAWLLGRQRPTYLIAAGLAFWLYALVAGAPPSALRAATMGTVYLAALGVGRPSSVLPALALAAAVMTALSPNLMRQISFQLSFAAVGGIALALALSGRLSWGSSPPSGLVKRLAGGAAALAVVSAAATLATWPLVAVNFGQIALLGVPVSLLTVPAMAPLIVSAFAAGVAGLVFGPLGQVLGWIAAAPSAYLIAVVSAFPAWTVEGGAWAGKPLLAAWYGGLTLALLAAQPQQTRRWRRQLSGGASRLRTMFGRRPAKVQEGPDATGPRWSLPGARFSMAAAAVLAIAGVILWLRVADGPDGNLHVHFLDVGQGDSTLIVTPSGRQVLIDGGPDGDRVSQELADILPGGDRSLDLVVMTHLDSDHSHGLLEVLDRYSVGAVLQGPLPPEGGAASEWKRRVEQREITSLDVHAGYAIGLGDGVALTVLNPRADSGFGDSNNDSVALRLTYGEFSLLLAADIEEEAERALLERRAVLSSHVLKVGHHGSRTSSTREFLQAVAPAVAVISSGAGNPYGHPAPSVIERLEEAVGAEGVYRTDLHGSVEVVSDGSATWVKTERHAPP